MEPSVPKIVMVVVALALVTGLGAWGYASANMRGELAAVRNESRAIGFSRGGRVPTDAQVREQVEAIAMAHGVELAGLTVASHEASGLGPVTSLVPQLGATLTGRHRVFEIRAMGTSRELVWALTEPIEVDLTLRVSVSTRPSESSVRPRMPEPGVSTDVHGGLRDDEMEVRATRGL